MNVTKEFNRYIAHLSEGLGHADRHAGLSKPVFDGKSLFHAAFLASAGLLTPDGKNRHEQEENLDAYRLRTAQFQA